MKIDAQCPICDWKGTDANEYMKHSKNCEEQAATVEQRNDAVTKRRAIVKEAGQELDYLRNNQVKVNPKRRMDEEPMSPSKVRVMESLSSTADVRRASRVNSPPKQHETTDSPLNLDPRDTSCVQAVSRR